MAVYLSKTWFPERRKVAVMQVFAWLTGYSSYADAYDNESETRVFTDEGVVGEYDSFKVPVGVDLNNKRQPKVLKLRNM